MLVTLERLQHADINLLRELRNANADAFFDSTYITREAQEDWWYRYQFDTATQFYSVWLNKVTPVGFLSVKSLGQLLLTDITVCEVGNLLLAPAHRGRGIMRRAVIEARRFYPELTYWLAHVKPTNQASLNLFAAQGFVQCDLKPARSKSKAATLEAR